MSVSQLIIKYYTVTKGVQETGDAIFIERVVVRYL